MTQRSKLFGLFVGLLALATELTSAGQLLQDTVTLGQIKKDIGYIYNIQIQESRELYSEIVAKYPDHPVVYLLKGMITYWQYYPLVSTNPETSSFVSDMRHCMKIAEENATPQNEAEYLLANLCARGFLLMYYSDNNLVMDVIPLVTGTYKFLIRSFDFTDVCTDLYYFKGMYNYYREAYPRAYPVYKPLALLFPKGNMAEGLRQLDIAANRSVVLSAEASSVLAYLFVNFENDYIRALRYSSSLHLKYPRNPEFTSFYITNLLLLKKYDEAEKVIHSVPDTCGNQFFKAQINVFRGLIYEKKYRDLASAQKFYNQGINELVKYGDYGNECEAYAYFGMSRISVEKGEKHSARMYKRQAQRLAAFKKVDFN